MDKRTLPAERRFRRKLWVFYRYAVRRMS